MRTSIALFVLMALLGAYWYQATAHICPTPIYYRLGDLDDSFGLSRDEAKKHIKDAEIIWEEALQQDLFVYDERADFTVDFIFDERQELADAEQSERSLLDQQLVENETVLATVEKLQADYESLTIDYQNRLAAYEERLTAYNQEVATYNDRGGAPADVFSRLESEQQSLKTEEQALSELVTDLNALVSDINSLSERGNALVDRYNQQVDRYNQNYGYEREFTQGDYRDGQIRIYKFSNENELVTVLAHEFGHALGIDHVEDDSALMYYLLEEGGVQSRLEQEDIAAYEAVCGVEETVGQHVRRWVRGLLFK